MKSIKNQLIKELESIKWNEGKRSNGESFVSTNQSNHAFLGMDVLEPFDDYSYVVARDFLETLKEHLDLTDTLSPTASIEEILNVLQNIDDDGFISEFSDGMCDIYNTDLLKWCGHQNHVEAIDEAIKEYGGNPDAGFIGMIQRGQYYYVRQECWKIIENIKSWLETLKIKAVKQ